MVSTVFHTKKTIRATCLHIRFQPLFFSSSQNRPGCHSAKCIKEYHYMRQNKASVGGGDRRGSGDVWIPPRIDGYIGDGEAVKRREC